MIKDGSLRDIKNSLFTILRQDEELLRLLYYFPQSSSRPDPLDPSLPNLTELDLGEYWDLVEERIMLAEKTSDLEELPLCRIYISLGRRRPIFNNYLLVRQEILISVYTHEDYESDDRNDRISDRIKELISLEQVKGAIGKMEYAAGDPYVAPTGYKNFRHRYRYIDGKK